MEKLNRLKEHIAHMSNQLPKFVTENASEGKDFSVGVRNTALQASQPYFLSSNLHFVIFQDSSSIASVYMHSQNGICSTPIDFTKLTSPEPNGISQGLSNRAKNTDDMPAIPYVTDEEVNKVPK